MTVNLFDPAHRADPYPVYEEYSERGPVVRDELTGMWVVTGYEPAMQVLGDTDRFSSAAPMGPDVFGAAVMLFSDPPDHGRLRAVVSRAFTPRAVALLEERVNAVTAELLAQAPIGEPWDAVAGLAGPLPVVVIAEMLGVPASDREWFRRMSDAVVGANLAIDPEGGARAVAAGMELRRYFAAAVGEREGDPGDDLIGRLVAANADGSMTEDELLAACVLLLVAGNETTTNLISNAVLALAGSSDHPADVAGFIEGVLRNDPPVQATVRLATAATALDGAMIAAGEPVLVLLAAASRDAEPGRHLAFGHGPHFCLGAPLARLEAQAALSMLLAYSPGGWTLAQPEERPPYGPSFFLRGITELSIVLAGQGEEPARSK